MLETKSTKVITYITNQERLLVFRHTQFPEAGIQVPAGTVELGESIEAAAMREAGEETGLKDLVMDERLGRDNIQVSLSGKTVTVTRHFFHLRLPGKAPQRWIHYEYNPSDGSPAPIEFEFFWVRFPSEVPRLSGNQGAFLHRMRRSLL
jgi:8-oxo-dGTP diphosphatase